MADLYADTIMEEREELMVSPTGGNPTLRIAHFLRPTFTSVKDLPPPSLSPKPTFSKLRTPRFNLISCKTSSPRKKWKKWVHILQPKFQNTWKKAGIFEAILASTYEIPRDRNLICALAERWCAETNTFIFPWGEVSVTLEDMIVLGGYSILGASFSTPLTKDIIDAFNNMRKGHKEIRLGGAGNVNTTRWMDYFMAGGKQLEHEAFLAMWLSRFVLVSSGCYIAVNMFPVAIHLSRGKRIALAPAVLASIYRVMRLLKSSIINSAKLGANCRGIDSLKFTWHAPLALVQLWAWERFSELRPNPNVMKFGEPRLGRWHGVKMPNVKDVRAALDSAQESFIWRPYATIAANNKLYREKEEWVMVDSNANVDIESLARCLRVSELVGVGGCIEQYLPHRVARQFGFDQDIPPYVIRFNESPEVSWRNYNRPIRDVKLYVPPQLFESDVSSRYMDWWGDFVSGSVYGTNSTRIQERSKNQSRDGNFLVTGGCPSRCVKQKPVEDYAEAGTNTNIECPSCKRKSCNFRKKKVFDDDKPVLQTYSRRSSGARNLEELIMMPKKLRTRRKSFFEKCMQLKSFTQEPAEYAVMVSEANYPLVSNVKIEEESSKTIEQVPQLELEVRISKLEMLVDEIKAAKFVASSWERLGK